MPNSQPSPTFPQPSPSTGGKVLRTFPQPPPIGGRGKVCTPPPRTTLKTPQPSPSTVVQINTLHDLHAALKTGHVFTTPGFQP